MSTPKPPKGFHIVERCCMTCEHRADESYYEDELHLCALRPRKKDSRPEVHPWCVCDSWKLTTNADVLEWIAEAGKDGVR